VFLLMCLAIALVSSLPQREHSFAGTSAFSFAPEFVFRSTHTTRTLSSLAFATTTSLEKDESTTPIAETTIRAAVYQPPIDDKMAAAVSAAADENPLSVLTKVADVLQLAARCGVDLVQFPELFMNGGLAETVVSGSSRAQLDRESYELNIVGNLCGELNVACVMGYAEAKHESDGGSTTNTGCGCYSSLAIFHADGSRAGNYRCVHPCGDSTTGPSSFEKGHALVETMPISLQLPPKPVAPSLQESLSLQPQKTNATAEPTRKVKIGAMCGGDLLVPEQVRHLARSGAELLVVSASLFDDSNHSHNQNQPSSSQLVKHVLPTRCMENELPLVFSNYVNDEKNDDGTDDGTDDIPLPFFVGQSAIVSRYGKELVRAPETLHGDMPSAEGYLLPCETGGALYAADIGMSSSSSNTDASIKDWDITPRIDGISSETTGKKNGDKNHRKKPRRKSQGFGREVVEVLENSKNKKLRLK